MKKYLESFKKFSADALMFAAILIACYALMVLSYVFA